MPSSDPLLLLTRGRQSIKADRKIMKDVASIVFQRSTLYEKQTTLKNETSTLLLDRSF